MGMDFTALRADIARAAERAFTELKARHRGEHFYAFALYTDDGAQTVVPAANSEEGFARKLALSGADETEYPHYRWSTGEWLYDAVGDEHFRGISDRLNAPGAAPSEEEDPSGEAFGAFKQGLLDAMTGALSDLEARGFFGKGAVREQVTLFASISDSDDAEEAENASARRLNPAPVLAAFLERYPESDADAEDDDEE
jgi:hypothetical protein